MRIIILIVFLITLVSSNKILEREALSEELDEDIILQRGEFGDGFRSQSINIGQRIQVNHDIKDRPVKPVNSVIRVKRDKPDNPDIKDKSVNPIYPGIKVRQVYKINPVKTDPPYPDINPFAPIYPDPPLPPPVEVEPPFL